MITKENVIETIQQINDPELHMNLWFLGLIYDISVTHSHVKVTMTFTTPFCPYGPSLVETVKNNIKKAGAESVDVVVVTDPPWQPSEEVKMALESM